MALIIVLWYFVSMVQMFLGYGTAYRYTKANGDNGISLFGWMIVTSFAAMIPGLGFYLWKKSLDEE